MSLTLASPQPLHFEKLDALRGIAALIVVSGHFAAMLHPGMVFGNSGSGTWEFLFSSTPLHLFVSGHFAVCLFFILSGFVLSVNTLAPGTRPGLREMLSALVRRPVRLAGIVLVTELSGFWCWKHGWLFNQEVSKLLNNPWLGWFWQGQPPDDALWKMANSPFLEAAQFNSPLWTITLELYGSWLVLVSMWLLTRTTTWRLAAMIMLFLALSWLPRWMTACGYQHALIPAGHWKLLQGFVIGMIAAQAWHAPPAGAIRCWKHRAVRRVWLTMGVLFASVPQYAPREGLFFGWLPSLPSELAGGYPMLGAIMIFICVLGGTGRQLLHHVFVRTLGKLSYAVYGCHFIIQASVGCFIYLQLASGGWNAHIASLAAFAATMLLTLATAHLLTRWIDSPCIRMASAIGKLIRLPRRRDA